MTPSLEFMKDARSSHAGRFEQSLRQSMSLAGAGREHAYTGGFW
jgi:hypothetical protein